MLQYETDILVSERHTDGSWTPRVVVEVKLKTINTHTIIAYSQKAAAHKSVHLVDVLASEVEASRRLKEMIYDSWLRSRDNYIVLRKPLVLKQPPAAGDSDKTSNRTEGTVRENEQRV